MGQKLFGVDVAGLVKKNIGPGLPAGTLVRNTVTGRGARLSAGVTSTPGSYPIRGMWIDYAPSKIDGQVVLLGDRQAMLIAEGLAITPQKGDDLTLPDPHTQQSITLKVERLEASDPAGATFTLHCRPDGA